MFHEKFRLDPRRQRQLRDILDYLDSQAPVVRKRLGEIFKEINTATLPRWKEKGMDIEAIQFFRGIDNNSLSLIWTGNSGWGQEFEEPLATVFTDWESEWRPVEFLRNRQQELNAIPVPLETYSPLFDQDRERVLHRLIEWNFITWFAWLWQESGGHACGIPSGIIQNNSVKTFDLFHMCWEDYLETEDRQSARNPFPRLLSRSEIFLRCAFDQPLFCQTSWRYFEKGDVFREIGLYGRFSAIREGRIAEVAGAPIRDLKTWAFKSPFNPYNRLYLELTKFGAAFCDTAIRDGYAEKPRPEGRPRHFLDDVPELTISGMMPIFPETDAVALAEQFEQKHALRLAPPYQAFLKMANGLQFKFKTGIPVSRTGWVNLEALFGFGPDQAFGLEAQYDHWKAILPNELIAVGRTETGDPVCLNTGPDRFGSVSLWFRDKHELLPLTDRFDDFLTNLFQSEYAETEEKYFARNNNVDYFRRRIRENWDVNTGYKQHDTALSAAAMANAHEVLEFLLQHGATLPVQWIDTVWQFDERTKALLKKYLY